MSETAIPGLLRIEGLSKRFGTHPVLTNVDLQIPAGATVALLGPSGSGKTTLLRIVAGLERADAGTIELGGSTLVDGDVHVPPEKRAIGMVFQDYAIFPHLSVGKNVQFGLPRRSPVGRVDEILELVGLGGFAQRMPGTLSGGQLQRVALARALAPSPSVLLLDEPFSNLDVALRVHVRGELHRLLRAALVTTLFVTHDQEEAFVLGDYVAVMRDGQVVQVGTPTQVYEQPVDPWTASFVGEVNLFKGRIANSQMATPLGVIPTLTSVTGTGVVAVRPEDVVVSIGGTAVIELVEYHGHDVMIEIRTEDGLLVRARSRRTSAHVGDGVTLSYAGAAATTFRDEAALGADPEGAGRIHG